MNEKTLVRCPTCKSRNRVPLSKLDATVRCGRCHEDFDLSSISQGKTIAVDESSFNVIVDQSIIPTLVDFWAPWCGPCRTVAPVLDALAQDWRGRVKIVKVNTDENRSLSARFGIQGIPTLVLLDGGQTIDTIVGALPKQELKSRVEGHLD